MRKYFCTVSYRTPAGTPGGVTVPIMAANASMAKRLAKFQVAKRGRIITNITAEVAA